MFITRSSLIFVLFLGLAAGRAWAGPPLICHTIDIGRQHSLPWRAAPGWNGADPSYDVARLGTDTLDVLAPGTPILVRMETLRRAAIYSAREPGLGQRLALRLIVRVLDGLANGSANPRAWFDAGYFLETLHQAAAVYPMLHGAEHEAWMIRSDDIALDGLPWIREAVRLGATDAQPVIAYVERARSRVSP